MARYFQLPGNPPGYGRFICELLARDDSGLDFALLDALRSRFDEEGDPVTQLVHAALDGSDAGSDASPHQPRFRTIEASGQQVWAVEHALLYQRQVESVLDYASVISRRTLVDWLYALTTLFMATYLLRMARAAESYSAWIESRFRRVQDGWVSRSTIRGSLRDWPTDTAMRVTLGSSSGSLSLRRKPSLRAASFSAGAVETDGPADLLGLGDAISRTLGAVDAEEALTMACDLYPTKIVGTRRWHLPAEEKRELLSISRDNDSHPFVVLTQYLNFEDMARSSNNVMEWQFYASVARNRLYGFARPGRGDALHYSLGERLLSCVAHCHAQQEGDRATLETFVGYLERLGFTFDGNGRQELERQLVLAGLLEAFADASDAKYSAPRTSPEQAYESRRDGSRRSARRLPPVSS